MANEAPQVLLPKGDLINDGQVSLLRRHRLMSGVGPNIKDIYFDGQLEKCSSLKEKLIDT